MSGERKQGIQDMARPISLKQLRSFLGMVNYFRDFIPHISTVLAPLTDLTCVSKNKEFVWNEDAERAFIEIKKLIVDSTSLTHLTESGVITLYTDASMMGIGAVLVQADENNVDHPILFLSQKFSSAAMNWATIEQECYAVYYSIITLQSYLLGRHFFVATDHRNLMYLEKSVVPKLVRWRLRLLEFHFTIIHISGVDNAVADVLSRALRMVTLDGIESEAYETFKQFHNEIIGHHGVSKTVQMIKDAKRQWIGYAKEVRNFIRHCPVCQKVKTQPMPNVITNKYTLSGSAPMRAMSVDAIGPLPEDENRNKFILMIIDNFSKFTELYATKSTTVAVG